MRLTSTTLLLLVLSSAGLAQDREFTLLERELDYLLQTWPGDYDNVEQTSFDAAAGAPERRRVHVSIERTDLPDLGEAVLTVREYWSNDPETITRHELYVIEPDAEVNALRAAVYRIDDGKPVLRSGCDLLIRRDATTLVGTTDGCTSSGTYQDYGLRVGVDSLWFRDGGAADQDTESWYQLEEARWFACMIDFPREPGGRPVVTHHYIKIHDQGGAFPFVHPDGRPMVLLMRNTWSYGMQRETFFIGVMDEVESGPTLVYAWGSPGSDRIGVNPGYLRVQCDLDSERHVELQHGLRPDS